MNRGWVRIALLAATLPALAVHPAAADAGVRIVPLAALASREAVQTVVSSAVAAGARSLLVPVGLFIEPPALLRDVVSAARAMGLQVVAAVDVTLAAGADELPAARDHVIYTHPEWLMVPRDLALDLLRLDVHSPDYAGRLARWTRANSAKAAGLYLSPVHRDAAAYVADAIGHLVTRYDFDGIQIEAARYPSSDFDYSRLTMDELRQALRPQLSGDERRRLDGMESLDALVYANEFPDAWRQFRQTQLTALIVRARTAIKTIKPDARVSAVVGADPAQALRDHLQDWATWIDNRFVDAVTADSADTPVKTAPPPAAALR